MVQKEAWDNGTQPVCYKDMQALIGQAMVIHVQLVWTLG